MLSEDELRECEEDARNHGIPYMLDRMGLDGIGNDVCDLHKRILELEAEVAAFQKLKLTLMAESNATARRVRALEAKGTSCCY